jgi:transcription antitermination factor NusG
MEMCEFTGKNEAANWYVAATLPRHEKRSAENLKLRGIECFLPISAVPRRWKNRAPVVLDLPLFPGYIFINSNHAKRFKALEVPGIRAFVMGIGKKPVTLPESEIEALRAGLNERPAESCKPFESGQRVRIARGPFAGLSGAVQMQGDRLTVIFMMAPIGQSVALDVKEEELEQVAL